MLTAVREKELTTPVEGTKLLCYSGNQYFAELEEYTLDKVNENGYYVGIGMGLSILFGSVESLRKTFMF
jgi:hypothetical protein